MIYENATSIFAPVRADPISQAPECVFEVLAQTRSGALTSVTRAAPVSAPFLTAFAVVGRGAVVETTRGSISVEDLSPGDRVMTSSGQMETMTWRGCVTLEPDLIKGLQLIRVPVDAYGPGRPDTDTLFGPGAMRVHRTKSVCTRLSASAVMSPLIDCADEGAMIPITPVAPVEFFQLGFSGQCGLDIGGIEIASLFVAQSGLDRISSATKATYMSLFPQYVHFEAAGRAMGPTLSQAEIDQLAA